MGIAKSENALNAGNSRAGANVGCTDTPAAKIIFSFSATLTMGAGTRRFKLTNDGLPVVAEWPTPPDPTNPPPYDPIDPTNPPSYPPIDPTNPPDPTYPSEPAPDPPTYPDDPVA